MSDNDKYTIYPFTHMIVAGRGAFIAGDMIDMITGDIIGGPYCVWPKQEPRRFIVTSGKTGGKSYKLEQILRDKFK